jgi:tetratricopeptide (TPR) repeat protein
VLAVSFLCAPLAPIPLAHAQKVSADNNSLAIGGAVTNSTINIGIPAEQLAALVRQSADLSEAQKKLIAKLEDELDLNQRQIKAAFAILGDANVAPRDLASRLIEFAERFKDLQLAASAKAGDDPKVAALRQGAQAALEAGDLERADGLLAEIETEQKGTLERLAVSAAETSTERAKIAMTRLRYRDAARHFDNAAATLPAGEAYDDKRIEYLKREAEAFYRQGFDFADRKALQSAIDLRARLVGMTRARNTPEAARIRLGLAMAMSVAGERERNAQRLSEAVAAYREVLAEFERLGDSWDLAVARFHFGLALRRLAPYEEDEIGRLEEAAEAFRVAEGEFARRRAALLRAHARMALTVTRVLIDERAEGRTPDLEQAVADHRTAAARISREQHPGAWITAQAKLGNMLAASGIRKNDVGTLEEAVAIYRGALEILRRERVPVFWASVQARLAHALRAIGVRNDDSARLDEAVGAFRAALEEFTRERNAGRWAFIQASLAATLVMLAERDGSTARLEQAIEAYGAALEEWTAEKEPERHAAVQSQLDAAVASLNEHKDR